MDMLRTLGSGLGNTSGFLSTSALSIEQGKEATSNSYIVTQYEEHYFWISGDDHESQELFMLIQLLIELTNTPDQVMSPILTISN